MASRLLFLPVLAAACLTGACGFDFGDGDQFQSDFHESRPFHAGDRLSVETFNGGIDIMTWDRNTVEITGTRHASTEEMLKDIKLDIQSSGNSLAVRAIRPSMSHGSMGVRMLLHVPRQVELERIVTSNGGVRINGVQGGAHVKTSNGAIHIDSLSGNLDAQTSNGAIDVDHVGGGAVMHTSNGHIEGEAVAGPVEATTSNGGIRLHLGPGGGAGPLHFSTSNGPIDLTMPGALKSELRARSSNGSITLHLAPSVNAHLHAATSNSAVTTDFTMTGQVTMAKHSIDGNLGSGGPSIDLTNSNGAIRILRAGE